MKITKRQLKQIIREESNKLNESARTQARLRARIDPNYEVPVGMEWDEPYDDEYDNPDYYARVTRSKRKTTYAGRGALEPMIKAVEAALAAKPNSFLQSVLGQMEAGRMPSAKQKAIVRRIVKKHNPASAQLFESAGAMPLIGVGALGGAPMSSRPAARADRRAISEAPGLRIDVFDNAIEALDKLKASVAATSYSYKLESWLEELKLLRADAYEMLASMGR